ncbi:MAG: alanine dehydrogenase [Acidimicrobiales bacterium]|jgi:alanine dehydrogenase|nr:alanine dehydrogenase [Acidimicrobiales bacterium]|tara:strand:- start:564 stop:1685 length:1122 start_codon:yes stop_codon:yes gene_type:complete
MDIGVPAEIKTAERRVSLTPAVVGELTSRGHRVVVENDAGLGAGFADAEYKEVGAAIAGSVDEVFDTSEMIVKVKEPQAVERARLKPHHTLFTYLHLAADRPQTDDLLASGATCIAYETVTDDAGCLPLLAPMSAIAGRMSIQAGAHALEATHGGAGLLLGGVPGVRPGKVVIIGGGVVGENAAEMAIGLGADVTVLDRSPAVLEGLSRRFGGRVRTVYSTSAELEASVLDADLVIGAVLVKGAKAPRLVTREMLSRMRDGSVLVDVAVDQGGCFETTRATTHTDPTFVVDGIVHYCVANMPGGVPRTSTLALSNATLPFTLALADQGTSAALRGNPHLLNGLNVCAGVVTDRAVAETFDLDLVDPLAALNLR